MAEMEIIEAKYRCDLGEYADDIMFCMDSADTVYGCIDNAVKMATEDFATWNSTVDEWIGKHVDLMQERIDDVGFKETLRQFAIWAYGDNMSAILEANADSIVSAYAANRFRVVHGIDFLDDGYWDYVDDRLAEGDSLDMLLDDIDSFIDEAADPSCIEAYATGVPVEDILL